MRILSRLPNLWMTFLIALPITALEAAPPRPWLDLGGRWWVAPGQGANFVEATKPDAAGDWREVSLPNFTLDPNDVDKKGASPLHDGPCCWARKTFTLTAAEVQRSAFLRWDLIRFGFEAAINDKVIGGTLYHCPGVLRIPAGLLRVGENELRLKVRPWRELPGTLFGSIPLVPSGGAPFGWGARSCAITGPVGLEFFDRFHLAAANLFPDPDNRTLTIRLRFDEYPSGFAPSARLQVTRSDGAEIARWEGTSRLDAAGVSRWEIPLPDGPRWSPENPNLLEAVLTVSWQGEEQSRTIRFGRRSFAARKGDFWLNGQPRTLFGSNLVNDWLWGADYYEDKDKAFTRYLFESGARMGVQAVRTHTLPPSARFADWCDEKGMMILAEMPLTYNYQPLSWTAGEARQYHDHARAMTLAWVEHLANHPSIVMWVSSNEAPWIATFDQRRWDYTEMIPAIQALDPSRPVLRSGEPSPDVDDMHCYAGWWDGVLGDYDRNVTRKALCRDPRRPIGNSEYIENATPARLAHWLGEGFNPMEGQMYYAMVAMRQTEILRRLDFDLILPYMLHGWTKGQWRPHAPTPIYGALRQALAPVGISLNLNDWDFLRGSNPPVSVWLINDTNETVDGQLSGHVLSANPEFNPDHEALRQSFFSQRISIGPRSRLTRDFFFPLPQTGPEAWLAATFRPDRGHRPVLSQRPVRIFEEVAMPPAAAKRSYQLCGAPEAARAWFRERGLTLLPEAGWEPVDYRSEADADVLIVWENVVGQPRDGNLINDLAGTVYNWLHQGKTVLMLAQSSWRAEEWAGSKGRLSEPMLLGFQGTPTAGTLVLPEAGPAAQRIWTGLDRRAAMQWNGYDQAVVRHSLGTIRTVDTVPGRVGMGDSIFSTPPRFKILAGRPSESNFLADLWLTPHNLQTEKGLVTRSFDALESKTPSLLCTEKAPAPAQPYFARYSFNSSEEVAGLLWVFENYRTWSSPFRWRIDGGSWQDALAPGAGQLYRLPNNGPVFGWTRLGEVRWAAGNHVLEVEVTGPRKDGQYVFSQDCFAVTEPGPPAQILARTSDGEPVLAEQTVWKGRLIYCQLLLDGRLSPNDPHYDPAAERFFVNLLESAGPGEP